MNTRSSLIRSLYIAVALVILAAGQALAGFSFVHISDIHVTASGRFKDNVAAVAGEVNSLNPQPDFVLVTGDIVEVGLPSELDQYKDAVKAFKMPLYHSPGNHETKWSNWGKDSYKRFFDQKAPYSFTHKNVHFVALDSSMWMQHHGLIDKSQLRWLKQDLEKAGKDTPSVLFYHHCPGFIPNEPELLKTVRPYNVRLILVGHGHSFKTWKKNGLLFQEGKGVMNDVGGFRLVTVDDNSIRTYTKVVGKELKEDALIPLSSKLNPVTLVQPKTGERVEGKVAIEAVVAPADGCKVEYSIDGEFKDLAPNAGASYKTLADFDGVPGWHIVTVRATDADGMEWTDTANVLIDPVKRQAWRFDASGSVQRAVNVIDGRVYFGTLGGDVYCLDASNGEQVWRYSAGSDVAGTVAAAGGVACFGTSEGKIIGVDSNTGKWKWEYRTGGPVMGCPVIADGKVLIGSGEPAFYALDLGNGSLKWKYPMLRMTQVTPLVIGDTVYFGAWDKHFHALRIKDGSLRWRTLIGINFYFSTADSDPVSDGKLIAVNVTPYQPEDPDIYCLDAKSGDIIWKLHNPGKSACGFNSPYLVGDKLYTVAGSGDVYCMNLADGKNLCSAPAGVTVYGSRPVVSDGKAYVTGLKGNVACVDTAAGKSLWSWSTGPGYIFSPATVYKDLIIVPSTDGAITAIKR